MFIRSLLHDRDVEPLGDAVLALLDKVGALYQNGERVMPNNGCCDSLDLYGSLTSFYIL